MEVIHECGGDAASERGANVLEKHMAQDCLGNGIPKIVHQIWLGSSVPQRFHRMVESLKIVYPQEEGWMHRLWTDDNTEDLVDNMPTKLLWNSSCIIARCNLLRYELMRRFGGVYVDMDVELNKPLGLALPSDHFAFCDADHNQPNQCMLISSEGHGFWEFVADSICRWTQGSESQLRDGQQQVHYTGHKAFARALHAYARPQWEPTRGVYAVNGERIGTAWADKFVHFEREVLQLFSLTPSQRRDVNFCEQVREVVSKHPMAHGIHWGVGEWSND